MITLVLHLMGLAMLASLGSVLLANFAIRYCVKHMGQCLTILGILVFSAVMGYGLYKHKPKVHFFDKVSTEVAGELEQLPGGIDLHRLIMSQTRQKSTVKLDITPRMDTAVFKVVSVYRKMMNDPQYKPLITSGWPGMKPWHLKVSPTASLARSDATTTYSLSPLYSSVTTRPGCHRSVRRAPCRRVSLSM